MSDLEQYIDPFKEIWGFHVHQELKLNDFKKSFLIQSQCQDYLISKNTKINHNDAIDAGYGPHLNPMWELRVEDEQSEALDKMGYAISYMCLNRFGFNGYIHSLRHDKDNDSDLKTQGEKNQSNILWFGDRVKQDQDFFFNPPLDKKGEILDTRTSRVFTENDKKAFSSISTGHLKNQDILLPEKTIKGFHVHLDFLDKDQAKAMKVFKRFMNYLHQNLVVFKETRIYKPKENGPHNLGGWQVLFDFKKESDLKLIGRIVGWFMCNRQDLSIFFHPVTWSIGDKQEELKAHQEYYFFLGEMPELDLGFFN